MDKIATNNHFVVLRKEIKKAKAMVSGNLIRKIAKLKDESAKLSDEDAKAKINTKISTIHNEIKMLKSIDSYLIAKKITLKPDSQYWDKVISDSKATTEEKLSARVMTKNNVLKQVTKFREEHVDLDEWLNEYIEYREKKREIVGNSSKIKTGAKKPFDKKGTTKNDRSKDRRTTNKLKHQNYNDDSTRRNQVKPHSDKTSHTNSISESKDSLHPSWEVKRREKEALQQLLKERAPRRVVFADD